MKKIIVGILPKIKINKSNNPYDDKYEFLDVYTKKVIECGAIPFGICLNNGNLDIDSLKICDCIILPGGDKIDKCYFEVIDYAIKNNIPLLGICLGFQAIALYSMVIEDENYNGSNFFDIYNKLKKENDNTLLKRIENHRKLEINYDNYKEAMHEINLNKNSLIYNAYKEEKVNVVSLHNFTPKYIGNNFKITAQSNDNIVEAIEYDSTNHYIVGVSFHPEWDENNYLIKRLIKEGKKLINYLILVNKKNKYISQNIKLVESKSLYANRLVEEKTLDTFNKLKEHLKNKGILIEIQSAYRDIDYQKRIWVNCVDKKGLEYTKKYVAKPGYSEHHTGLAIDFCLNENNKFIIEHDLDNNESLKIIHDNLYKFGFILRYPKNKENITGYNYEPWHIRFIDDKNIAKYIYENNMCLEDYLNDK